MKKVFTLEELISFIPKNVDNKKVNELADKLVGNSNIERFGTIQLVKCGSKYFLCEGIDRIIALQKKGFALDYNIECEIIR